MCITRPSGLEIIGFPSYVSIEAVTCGFRHICGEMVWEKGNMGRHACLAVSDTPQRRWRKKKITLAPGVKQRYHLQ